LESGSSDGGDRVGGIHHVTALAEDPQENLDFHAGVLGLRLVKRSVNQDEVALYHLFYADATGTPGTDLTFFPVRGGRPGRPGHGVVDEVAFAVRPESIDWWHDRLERHGVQARRAGARFGGQVVTFRDPHGLALALVADATARDRPFAPWTRGSVPPEHQLRGFRSVRIRARSAGAPLGVAAEALGMRLQATDGGWSRYVGRDEWSGGLEIREAPEGGHGHVGVGSVHHVAWRTLHEAQEARLEARVLQRGLHTTGFVDRFYFKSIYFREPGGVLFELATDGPGMEVDEPADALGERLVLPPWLEPQRGRIQHGLPPLTLPHLRGAAARPPG